MSYEGSKIEIPGTDGSLWTYNAVSGSGCPPTEVGWVLAIEGGSQALPDQRLSIEEVIGDLDAMMPGELTTREAVTALTEGMIKTLQEQCDGLRNEGKDPSEALSRARQLRDELNAALGAE